jgi:hypothetical protein
VLTQAFCPEVAVERLDEGIVRRLPRPAEFESDAMAIRPGVQRAGDELGPVIHRDRLRQACESASRSRISTTRPSAKDRAASMAGLTLLTLSTNVKARNRRPSARLSETKSLLHRSLGEVARWTTRGALTRFLRLLRRRDSPSSW